jgi:hypothetical protein
MEDRRWRIAKGERRGVSPPVGPSVCEDEALEDGGWRMEDGGWRIEDAGLAKLMNGMARLA